MAYSICTVSGIYPPDKGGPAHFAKEFSNWQLENGGRPKVITLTDSHSSKEEGEGFEISKITRKQNLVTRYFETAKAIHGVLQSNHSLLINGCFLEALAATVFSKNKYVAKVPGDIVWERARNSGKTILDIQSFQTTKLKWNYRIFRFFFTQSLNKARKVIVPSFELRDLCMNWGISKSKLIVIFNSVSPKVFYKMEDTTKEFDVISVGRLVSWKGNSELIQACSLLGLRLAIVGSGPEMQVLKKEAEKSQTSISFLGEVPTSDLCAVYNSAKLFVLNSSYEGTSHALLEARACGLFAIARANVGSNRDIVDHLSDGILFAGDTGISLTEALRLAVGNTINLLTASDLAIQNTISRFGIQANFDEIREVIEGPL